MILNYNQYKSTFRYASNNLNYIYYYEYYKDINFIETDLEKKKGSSRTSKPDQPDASVNNEGRLDVHNQSLAGFNPHTCMDPLDKQTAPHSFELHTEYPGLLVGTGIAHAFGGKGEAALGLCLDYVTGMPYIPGSSVKGLLRSAFAHKEYIKGLLTNADGIDIAELEARIFGDPIKGKKIGVKISEQDTFYDAIVVSQGQLLATDSITAHRHNKDLLELAAPNPITMMRIRPGVKFQFQFSLKEKTCGVTADQKLKLFKQILLDFGIGAKTNVGYGLLEECNTDEQANVSEESDASFEPKIELAMPFPAPNTGICKYCGGITKLNKRTGVPWEQCSDCANKRKR